MTLLLPPGIKGLKNKKTSSLRYTNRFNSLKHVQQCDRIILIKRKEKIQRKKYTLFHKQHFYKQHPWQNYKLTKIKQKLDNTLRLKFCYIKIIRFLQPRYHLKIVGDILKNVQEQVRLL